MTFIHFVIVFLIILILPGHSAAQQQTASLSCGFAAEVIENLRPPRLGTYSLWDLVFGAPLSDEQFTDFHMMNDRTIIGAGRVRAHDGGSRPLIAVINRRGRVEWRWTDAQADRPARDIRLKKLIPHEDKFIVLGELFAQKQRSKIWIGVITRGGTLEREAILSDARYHLTFGDMIRNAEGDGWLVAKQMRARPLGQSGPQGAAFDPVFSRFAVLDEAFRVRWQRDFVPGPHNQVNNLTLLTDEVGEPFYVAAGHILDRFNRPSGLVMRMNIEGSISWQRSYPRGEGSSFAQIGALQGGLSNGDLIALGQASPIEGEGRRAGWLMRLDAGNGTTVFERYYNHNDVSYQGKKLHLFADGRIGMLLSGETAIDSELVSHGRLMTLSPRGVMLSDHSYTDAGGVVVHDYEIGPRGFVAIAGEVTVEEPDPNNLAEQTVISQKAWVLVTESNEPYKDPCEPVRRFGNE